jgi:hypothetical protein
MKSRIQREPGRKTLYSAELRDRICERIIQGASWRDIEREGLACQRTIANWRHTIPEFNTAYVIAREASAEGLMEEINAVLEGLGKEPSASEINAARLQVDTLKWKMRCYYPRVYGTKLSITEEASAAVPQYDYSRLSDSEARTLRDLLLKCWIRQEDDLIPG